MHMDVNTKREREKAVVSEMIALYCRKRHGGKKGLCPECAALAAYARQRSDNARLWRQRHFVLIVRYIVTSLK